MGFEPVNERRLGWIELLPCYLETEPVASIHLREPAPAARAPRPLDPHQITCEACRVGIALPRPRMDQLPGLLAYTSKGEEGARGADTRLLLKLAARCHKWLFTVGYQTFGNAPGTRIAMSPERTTRMRQQDFERVAGAAI
jgi:hypothetical protein